MQAAAGALTALCAPDLKLFAGDTLPFALSAKGGHCLVTSIFASPKPPAPEASAYETPWLSHILRSSEDRPGRPLFRSSPAG